MTGETLNNVQCLSVLVVVLISISSYTLTTVHSQDISVECGTINIAKELIIEGNQTLKGFWPFSVAIVEVQEHRPFCGGTLISRKHVLTAAHCIHDKYTPADIVVILGAYGLLSKAEEVIKQANVSDFLFHPNWNQTTLEANIAVLVLSNSIALTTDIQIVCLPADDDVINDAKGFLVGWDLMQQTPKHSNVTVMNNSHCNTENHILDLFLSHQTFCAGGDKNLLTKKVSGGGFFTTYGKAWVQHGIAMEVVRGNFSDLATSNETIAFLTRVYPYNSWIVDAVRQTGGEIGEATKGKINLDCDFIRLYVSYACFAHNLNVPEGNYVAATAIGTHQWYGNNDKIELLQFHNGRMLQLVNGLGKLFPNLKVILVGYTDAPTLHTTFIRRSNFQNMKNLSEIAIHKSNIETVAEDLLWDLLNLKRFQIDGRIKELPERLFERNRKLEEVYLASNALEYLPKRLFKNNLALHWVNFADNALKRIDTNFMRLNQIQYIFLDSNICIDKSFNRSAAEQVDYQYDDENENVSETAGSQQVLTVFQLQRLIYWNCTSNMRERCCFV